MGYNRYRVKSTIKSFRDLEVYLKTISPLDEKTSKLFPKKINTLLDHRIKSIYEMATESGRITVEHPYFVKVNSDTLGIGAMSKSSSSKVIKYPSKSAGFTFFLSKLENAEINVSGLSCGNFNNTTENIFSLGNYEKLIKCLSLETNTLCSDIEDSANLPLESPFGLNITSQEDINEIDYLNGFTKNA